MLRQTAVVLGEGAMVKRILAIDSSETLRELYREILTDEGYTVFLFPYRVLERTEIEHINPDLMILDCVSGNEATGRQILQNIERWRFTFPILICTTSASFLRNMQGSLHRERLNYLSKPFDVQDLIMTVQTMLGRRNRL
jgi:two-component system, OmpR family, response regulator